MNDNTILEVEGRSYINPQTGLDERLQFVDTLRDVQAQNTAQINQDTYNLGSQVPSNVGGLTGSEGLWRAQYQTPQLDAQVADLRATAQQQALNQAMQNVSDIETNRLKQAYRGYYARKKAQEDADRNRNQNPATNTPELPIDTTTPGTGDLTVETAPVTVNNTQLAQNAWKNAVYKAANSDNFNWKNSQGLTFTENGVPYYVVLYRDGVGKVTGSSTYTGQDGNLVHVGDRNANGTTGFLNNVGRTGGTLYDMSGSDVTRTWSLI